MAKSSSYVEAYEYSLSDPESFWGEQARSLDWIEPPNTVLAKQDGVWRWFVDGKLNTAWLCLERHIKNGLGDQAALIYDSPVTGDKQSFTYKELETRVGKVAGALVADGVGLGDRVVIYMPMVPEAVIAMLACARIGAIHSVVFGGFAAHELASRIDDATPKAILTATCGIEFEKVIPYLPLVEAARSIASHSVQRVVVLERQQSPVDKQLTGSVDWRTWEAEATPAPYATVKATDTLYILYTSGTTGAPKGIVRDHGGHAVALHYSMDAIYGVDQGDVFWASSDVGWVVGHSYIVYGPLLKGCTTILYEGKPVRTPDAGAFWRVISEYKVRSFFVAPTAFRAVKKEDPNCELLAQYDISSLEYVFVAGEKLDPPTWYWLQEHVDRPIIDHWWQTETGWSICANMVGYGLHEMRPGSITFPVPGNDLRIFDEDGNECEPNAEGNVVVKEPLPPGTLPTVWGDPERFVSSYWSTYPGWYLTGDGGYKDEDGYVYVMGRVDDVMNVAGHRLSTGQLEEALARHPAVAECAVVGLNDEEKGQIPVGLVLLKDGVNVAKQELVADLVQLVRSNVGAFANLKQIAVVNRLPKTRSGKILRQIVRKIGNAEDYRVPSTIEDPQALEEITKVMQAEGMVHES